MVLKTFSVQEQVFEKFSKYCKERGMSMSKQIEIFMGSIAEDEPVAKKEYLDRLEKIRKGKFIRVDNFAKRYKL
ncbi:hypothetical protein HOC35_05055 [Candidatus Woesearchaeota archaeon]|jgi:hypothetical protein|nr:hypothetical protein [Candidatus Woesearchaeota archaeon]